MSVSAKNRPSVTDQFRLKMSKIVKEQYDSNVRCKENLRKKMIGNRHAAGQHHIMSDSTKQKISNKAIERYKEIPSLKQHINDLNKIKLQCPHCSAIMPKGPLAVHVKYKHT